MRMVDIIEKKKQGQPLTAEEIGYFVNGYTNGEIPDYQAAALLMAICLRGMNGEETFALSEAMCDSGEKADLSCFGGRTVDKHSTGGVGDKTSLIVLPIAASLGCIAAKMSGRGLGHTGGTVDKLESIPGYRTALSPAEFRSAAAETGIALIGQSGDFAPADGKIYALRDVTATVDCIPLIASSIMSKKLAAGADVIVLDVKTGSGAFMKTREEALRLAEIMTAIGERHGKKCAAIVTDMEKPLGRAVGNALEVKEAVFLLKNAGDPAAVAGLADLEEVCLTLAAEMVSLCFGMPREEALAACRRSLVSGHAYETFCRWIRRQGGDLSFTEDPEHFRPARYRADFRADQSGVIAKMDAEKVGKAAAALGAGRIRKDDKIDFSAGILLDRKPGERVEKGGTVARLYSSVTEDFTEAERLLAEAVRIEAGD